MKIVKDMVRFEISWHTLWKLLIFALLIVGLYLARDVIGILFVAIVISLAIDPMVTFLEKKKINRLMGTVIVFATGVLIVGLVAYLFIPVLIIESSNFLKHIHEITYKIFGIGLPDNLVDTLTFGRDKLFGALSNINTSIAGTIASLVKTGIFIVATVLISFYLSVEKQGTKRLLRVLIPDEYEKPILKIFSRFEVKIRRWFIAQFLLSTIVGIIVIVGMWLLGVRNPVLLGVLAALFEVVPIIGPVIVGAIAFLVAVSDSFILGVYAVIFFIIVQQFENHILTPNIIGRTMKVHPVVVIGALLAGGKIAGVIGIILAVPLAVLGQEIFNYLSERKDEREGVTPPKS